MTKKEQEELEKTSLKWRLPDLPDATEIASLVEQDVITTEEARELLFSEETKDEKIKALEEQVEFLRNLAEKLANQTPQVVYKYIHDYRPERVWLTTTTPTPYKLMGNQFVNTVMGAIGAGMGATTSTNARVNSAGVKIIDN